MELTIKWSKVEISRFTPSGWKDILVRDFEFVAKPQFLWDNLIVLDGFQALIFPNVWFIKHFYAAIGRNRALPLMLGFYKAELNRPLIPNAQFQGRESFRGNARFLPYRNRALVIMVGHYDHFVGDPQLFIGDRFLQCRNRAISLFLCFYKTETAHYPYFSVSIRQKPHITPISRFL